MFRQVEEECDLLRSGVRFWPEKMQRTEESPAAIEIRSYERISLGTKKPYSDEGYDHAILDTEEIQTQCNNVPTPPCTLS